MPNSSVEIDTRRLDRILRNLDGNVADNLAAVGFSVEAKAKQKAPVDTGALRNSIYTRTYDRDEINQVASEVLSRNPDAIVTSLPQPENKHTVHVGPSVNYAVHVELGTNRMAGRPFLQQAVRDVENELAARMGDAITDNGR